MVNACYCFIVVHVVPSGKIISQKMTAYLEEVATKKRSGENLLNEAKRMRLASLTPSVVGIYTECKYGGSLGQPGSSCAKARLVRPR